MARSPVWLGHLAQDCFHRPGDKAYELIEDDVVVASSAADVSDTDVVHKKKVSMLCWSCCLVFTLCVNEGKLCACYVAAGILDVLICERLPSLD